MKLLQRTATLLALLVMFVALTAALFLWRPFVGGTFLDSVSLVADSEALLASMSAVQKRSHYQMTLYLDMLYPLIYGGLFAGVTLKCYGRAGAWLAIPAMVVVPVDIAENVIQLQALAGHQGWLQGKEFLTPAKVALFVVAALIALAAILRGFGEYLTSGRWRK